MRRWRNRGYPADGFSSFFSPLYAMTDPSKRGKDGDASFDSETGPPPLPLFPLFFSLFYSQFREPPTGARGTGAGCSENTWTRRYPPRVRFFLFPFFFSFPFFLLSLPFFGRNQAASVLPGTSRRHTIQRRSRRPFSRIRQCSSFFCFFFPSLSLRTSGSCTAILHVRCDLGAVKPSLFSFSFPFSPYPDAATAEWLEG